MNIDIIIPKLNNCLRIILLDDLHHIVFVNLKAYCSCSNTSITIVLY